MPKNLVIVESPAKAKTISRYLGKDYEVVASVGHVRDLPSKTMAVDIENDFQPAYEIVPGKKSMIQNLKKLAKNSSIVYLATDPDREGEAISWHILESIGTTTVAKRVIFHEITENGIVEAFDKPTSLNMELVNAQQARRILDRVVGYELSPLLWKKFTSGYKLGLSAGRVQSVALKLIVEREREISNFKPEEYWNISVNLRKKDSTQTSFFNARIIGSKKYRKDEARNIERNLESSNFSVGKIGRKTSNLKPPAPFTTSTLQQEASRKIRGFSVARTMRVAQQLYEGVPLGADGETGLITYMRTDSTTISTTAVLELNRFITEFYGDKYLGTGTRINRRKKLVAAQEAHEAIRPTSIFFTPAKVEKYLSPEQFSLYTLIWKRTLASRMSDFVSRITTINIEAKYNASVSYKFSCSGSEPKFNGYTTLYNGEVNKIENNIEDDDLQDNVEYLAKLPVVSDGDELVLLAVSNEQKFTRPSPRFTQATFVRTLEESGIGRPSTYASIMATLEGRNYCSLENGRYRAELLGEAIVDQLNPFFPNIMDVGFTAKMESNLDEIANGNKRWVTVLKEFYYPYREMFLKAELSMPKVTVQKITGESCPECERPLAEKIGRNGKFIACTGFPECRYSRPYLILTGVPCPLCEGSLVQRRAKKGSRVFYGCSRYPDCDFSLRQRPISSPCPDCQEILVVSGRNGVSCTACGFNGNLSDFEIDSEATEVAGGKGVAIGVGLGRGVAI